MAHVAPLPGPKPAVPVPDDLRQQVAAALMEDIRGGDLTAALIPPERGGRATVITREAAILCGIPYVEATFRHLDSRVTFDWRVLEGEAVSANQVLFSVDGPARTLLTGERTALNFLQLLSDNGSSLRAVASRNALPPARHSENHSRIANRAKIRGTRGRRAQSSHGVI